MLNLKRREQLAIMGILFLVVLSLIYKLIIVKPQPIPTQGFIESSSQGATIINREIIMVHVAGEVIKPGVYQLELGSRVIDAIKAAGGITEKADEHRLNLVKPLEDGDKITVPGKVDGVDNGQGTASVDSTKVNINYGSLEQLQRLPGIGPVKAKDIIGYREKNGYFTSIEELTKVNGIGDKTLEKIKDLIDI